MPHSQQQVRDVGVIKLHLQPPLLFHGRFGGKKKRERSEHGLERRVPPPPPYQCLGKKDRLFGIREQHLEQIYGAKTVRQLTKNNKKCVIQYENHN